MGNQVTAFTSNPMLGGYSAFLARNAIAPLAEFIAPTVPVQTMVGRYKIWNAEKFLTIPDTKRAIGGRAVEITFDGNDGTYDCTPHGIDCPVDILIENEAQMMDVVKKHGSMAAQIAAMQHEKRVIDLLSTVSASVTIKPNKTSSPDDAIDAIDEGIKTVVKAIAWGSSVGLRVAIGPTAYKIIKNSAPVRGRFTANGSGGTNNPIPGFTTDSLSKLLMGEPDVKMSWMVYNSAAPGKTISTSFMLDSDVYIFGAMQTPTEFDPSFMKTFRLDGQWMIPGTYMREDGRAQVAKFDWTEDVKITNTPACYRITVSAATS